MYLIPHTSDPLQTQNFTHEGWDLTLTTRWNSVVGFWNIDVFDNLKQEYITQGEALAVGSACMEQSLAPFVIVMLDDSGLGTGAVSRDELGNRLNIYLVDEDAYHAAVRSSVSVNYRE